MSLVQARRWASVLSLLAISATPAAAQEVTLSATTTGCFYLFSTPATCTSSPLSFLNGGQLAFTPWAACDEQLDRARVPRRLQARECGLERCAIEVSARVPAQADEFQGVGVDAAGRRDRELGLCWLVGDRLGRVGSGRWGLCHR